MIIKSKEKVAFFTFRLLNVWLGLSLSDELAQLIHLPESHFSDKRVR